MRCIRIIFKSIRKAGFTEEKQKKVNNEFFVVVMYRMTNQIKYFSN